MYKTPTSFKVLFLSALCTICAHAQQPSRASAQKWAADIKKFEEDDQHNPPAKGAVLFIGSSSITAWKELADDFPSSKVINRGFGGSEIADSIHYIDRIVVPYQPRMVVLYAGDNDLANGRTPEQVFADYKEFVRRVRQELPEARIAFISIKPSPARWHLIESMKAANRMIKSYASGSRELMYIDIFTPMLGQDGRPRPELFGADMLHMNKEGYGLWKSAIARYIR